MKRVSKGVYIGKSKPLNKVFTLSFNAENGLWTLKIEGHKNVLESTKKKALLSQLQYMEQHHSQTNEAA